MAAHSPTPRATRVALLFGTTGQSCLVAGGWNDNAFDEQALAANSQATIACAPLPAAGQCSTHAEIANFRQEAQPECDLCVWVAANGADDYDQHMDALATCAPAASPTDCDIMDVREYLEPADQQSGPSMSASCTCLSFRAGVCAVVRQLQPRLSACDCWLTNNTLCGQQARFV